VHEYSFDCPALQPVRVQATGGGEHSRQPAGATERGGYRCLRVRRLSSSHAGLINHSVMAERGGAGVGGWGGNIMCYGSDPPPSSHPSTPTLCHMCAPRSLSFGGGGDGSALHVSPTRSPVKGTLPAPSTGKSMGGRRFQFEGDDPRRASLSTASVYVMLLCWGCLPQDGGM
jgi:hypothetical protein